MSAGESFLSDVSLCIGGSEAGNYSMGAEAPQTCLMPHNTSEGALLTQCQ